MDVIDDKTLKVEVSSSAFPKDLLVVETECDGSSFLSARFSSRSLNSMSNSLVRSAEIAETSEDVAETVEEVVVVD